MRYRSPLLHAAPTSSGAAPLCIHFKSLGKGEYPSSVLWPPAPPDHSERSGAVGPSPASTMTSSPAATEGSSKDAYRSYKRSVFSVLRSRQCQPDCCASGILGSHSSLPVPMYKTPALPLPRCERVLCCCSALLYQMQSSSSSLPPVSSSSMTPDTVVEGAERARDDFLWALNLAGVEHLLRITIGDELFLRLVGVTGKNSAVVLTCSDLLPETQKCSHDNAVAAAAVTLRTSSSHNVYVARLLLNADEDSRVKWLQEESSMMTEHDYYSRAPSLRALYVMWSVQEWQARQRRAATAGRGDDGDRSGRFRGGGEGSDAEERKGNGCLGAPTSPSPMDRPLTPLPSMKDIQRVLMRIEERHATLTMADMAVMVVIGAQAASKEGVAPESEFWEALTGRMQARPLVEALAAPASHSPQTDYQREGSPVQALVLQHIFLLCSLLQYISLANFEMQQADMAPLSATSQSSSSSITSFSHGQPALPMEALKAASNARQLRKALALSGGTGEGAHEGGMGEGAEGRTIVPLSHLSDSSAAGREALLLLCDAVVKNAYGLAEKAQTPSSSPHLSELTTWLLREMISSSTCEYHFKLLVNRSTTEAMVALEKSGLVGRSSTDLKVVVRQLLPLVESCENEDVYVSVLRNVLSMLEERARRDRNAFTREDLRYLAELGSNLFASSSTDGVTGGYGVFDETARGQMEELHVMDGSPWALCVSSYRSLKEMIQGIIGDQRRLKQQVQGQLRQLSNSSALSAVMMGSEKARLRCDMAHHGEEEKVKGALATSSSAISPQGTKVADTTVAAQTTTGSDHRDCSPEEKPAEDAPTSPPPPSRIPVSPMLRQRFLVLLEALVKAQVDENSSNAERPIVVSSELFAFVTQHVPVPNIQDEYRRKIFLLVNVADTPETTRRRLAERAKVRTERFDRNGRRRPRGRLSQRAAVGTAKTVTGAADETGSTPAEAVLGDPNGETDDDPHGGANDIPAELRFLVSSLPLTLSPWASVMILREVLAESAGRNPRYTYVLNAAIDLQLPMSTTRSRIATTLNMWRFLNTQAQKLSLKESLMMKQRCAWNLPMAYVLSSYWSLLTWIVLASIVLLNVIGIDYESQMVASSLFRMFAPWEEICVPLSYDSDAEALTTQAAADIASDYLGQVEIADRCREDPLRTRANVFLSSASYLILGYDDQRRPMTVIPVGSDRGDPAEVRSVEEYAAATAVLRELSLHVPFPFFVDVERPLSMEYLEKRVAERIRRVSFNNTWFGPRMIIRTFPLGRSYTERNLVLHTCTQANVSRRRITFLLYMHDGVPVTPQFIQELHESVLSNNANLVLVAHESSLLKGGTTPKILAQLGEPRAGDCTGDAHKSASVGIMGAAAELMDAVQPSEGLRSSVAEDYSIRVLPYCRQFYCTDDAIRSPGLHDGLTPPQVFSSVPEAAVLTRWWRWCFPPAKPSPSSVDESERAPFPYGSRDSPAARLPPFASAFFDRRASLRRHREWQDGAHRTTDPLPPQELQPTASSHTEGATLADPLVNHKRSVFSSIATTFPWMTRRRASAEVEKGAEKVERNLSPGSSPEDKALPRKEKAEGRATASATNETSSANGKGVVSVSLTALRHLMLEVSAPVSVSREKLRTSTKGDSGDGTPPLRSMAVGKPKTADGVPARRGASAVVRESVGGETPPGREPQTVTHQHTETATDGRLTTTTPSTPLPTGRASGKMDCKPREGSATTSFPYLSSSMSKLSSFAIPTVPRCTYSSLNMPQLFGSTNTASRQAVEREW